jgi:DNA (cytosine-5)-methyltransferase 1
MKILDLFAGIGGFSLAAHWLNWQTVAFVEKDKFCQKVLAKNFKGVPIYDDITTFSGEPFRGSVDIVTGGFPCQPFSQAGEQNGANDERYLFPEMLRVIREVQPNFIVAENVYGLLSRKFERTFEEICSSLENLNYSVQSLVIPACAVNAPHRRYRVWIIANSKTVQRKAIKRGESNGNYQSHSVSANADGAGLQRCDPKTYRTRKPETSLRLRDWNDSRSDVAAEFCRMDARVSNRVDRLRSLGNAIVPQIAYELFKAIEASENYF